MAARPDAASLALGSLALGAALAAGLTLLAHRKVVDGSDAYQRYAAATHPHPAGRTLGWTSLALAAVTAPLLLLSLDCYAHFDDDHVAVNRFWGLGERQAPYADVKAIRSYLPPPPTSKNDALGWPGYEVELADGTVFSTTAGGRRPTDRDWVPIAFLAKRSGRPVEPHPAR